MPSEASVKVRRKIEIKIIDDNAVPAASAPICDVSSWRSNALASALRKSRSSIVSLSQNQLRRRESALSLFSLTTSAEQKRVEYLNQLYEEKVREQDEYTSLLKAGSRLVQRHRTSNGSFSLNVPSSRDRYGSIPFSNIQSSDIDLKM